MVTVKIEERLTVQCPVPADPDEVAQFSEGCARAATNGYMLKDATAFTASQFDNSTVKLVLVFEKT